MKVRLDLTLFLFSVWEDVGAERWDGVACVCVCVIFRVELACHCSLCITPLLLSSVSFLFLWCCEFAIYFFCLFSHSLQRFEVLIVTHGISYRLKSFSEAANRTREAIFGHAGTEHVQVLPSFSHEYDSKFELSAKPNVLL